MEDETWGNEPKEERVGGRKKALEREIEREKLEGEREKKYEREREH